MGDNLFLIYVVNKMGYEEFIKCFGNVVEYCSFCVVVVWRECLFCDVENLVSCFGDFIDWLLISGMYLIF